MDNCPLMSVDHRVMVVGMMSVVEEVDWLNHTVVKVRMVVLKGAWALLVVGTPVVGTVAEIHESFQSIAPSWGQLSQT